MTASKLNFSVVYLFFIFFFINAQQGLAQRDRSKRDREESSKFAEKLWYGGGFTLGFGASNGVSEFGLGVSPMVGYKVLDFLSVGPRFSLLYTSLKVQGYKAINLFDYQIGAFLRARVFQGFFLQGELAQEWYQDGAIFGPDDIRKLNYTRSNQLIGAGWNSSMGEGGIGTELGIFYNVAIANDENTSRNPLEYRFGITWRF